MSGGRPARKMGLGGHVSGLLRRGVPLAGTRSFALWQAFTALNTFLFRISRGRVSGSFDGAPVLLLHHTGRRSGQVRIAPLLYLPDGESFVIIGSRGGSAVNPGWYYNLRALPDTIVELRGRRVAVHAVDVPDGERDQVWERVVDMFPAFDRYRTRTTRTIPLVRLIPR